MMWPFLVANEAETIRTIREPSLWKFYRWTGLISRIGNIAKSWTFRLPFIQYYYIICIERLFLESEEHAVRRKNPY